MESMRHSSFVAEPSGAPSSNQARRYQSPSQAWFSKAVASAPHVRPPFRRARRVAARIGQICEGVKRGVQHPAKPDAFALAACADTVHAVVPVAAADQRQAVAADRQAGVQGPGAMLVEAGSLGPRRSAGRSASLSPGSSSGPSRKGTASSSTAASPVTST